MDSSSDNRRLPGRSALSGLLLVGLCFSPGCCRSPGSDSGAAGARVVSLAPSLTEIVCAIGAETQLVGRTSYCNYPPDKVKAVPVVGGFGAPSFDLLLKIRPTLVLTMDLQDESAGAMLDQLGLKRERIACSKVDDIPRAILQVGRLTHSEEIARKLAEPMRRQIENLRRQAENRRTAGKPAPTVFVEIWDDPLTTVGKQSFISDLIFLAGGRNLGDEMTDKDYFAVSHEWVIARNPDVIICLYMSKARKSGSRDRGNESVLARVAGRTGWAEIAAVKNKRVYDDLDNNVILRPGPRVLAGIEALRQCIETSGHL